VLVQVAQIVRDKAAFADSIDAMRASGLKTKENDDL